MTSAGTSRESWFKCLGLDIPIAVVAVVLSWSTELVFDGESHFCLEQSRPPVMLFEFLEPLARGFKSQNPRGLEANDDPQEENLTRFEFKSIYVAEDLYAFIPPDELLVNCITRSFQSIASQLIGYPK